MYGVCDYMTLDYTKGGIKLSCDDDALMLHLIKEYHAHNVKESTIGMPNFWNHFT